MEIPSSFFLLVWLGVKNAQTSNPSTQTTGSSRCIKVLESRKNIGLETRNKGKES
jgi:hypothetical protein